jgi:hypothetical protein
LELKKNPGRWLDDGDPEAKGILFGSHTSSPTARMSARALLRSTTPGRIL